MKNQLTIIDYGAGNLHSVVKACEKLGFSVVKTSDPNIIKKAAFLVLPGQGAFAQIMNQLHTMGLVDYLQGYLKEQRPFLGICIGFQILFEESQEHGRHKGLGVFEGQILPFQFKDKTLKIPHMGWNTLKIKQDPMGLYEKEKDPYVYFVHSYYLKTNNTKIISTTTEYGLEFVSSIQAKNIWATQFHPEKSGEIGLKMLYQFTKQIGMMAEGPIAAKRV